MIPPLWSPLGMLCWMPLAKCLLPTLPAACLLSKKGGVEAFKKPDYNLCICDTDLSNQVFGTGWGLTGLLVTLRSKADLCEDPPVPPTRATPCSTFQ